jgi:two-component system, chemotaxis family, protein-glutamate methylesterase/glutaminase
MKKNTKPADVAAVVIGASAGGVEALGVLLPALDARCRAAVLIVVHLPRERPSLLKNLYAARCALPICEAVDKQQVEPGTVYFAPPDYHLLVDCHEGEPPSLALSVDEPVHHSRPSIDVLFESAAECWGGQLMGIVLTGASEDGARGLGAVAAAGGLTIAQLPSEAVAPTLPAAAVRDGAAQQVLNLAGIRELFTQLVPTA